MYSIARKIKEYQIPYVVKLTENRKVLQMSINDIPRTAAFLQVASPSRARRGR
jgi:DUF971 family protein